MDDATDNRRDDKERRNAGRRFLVVFAVCVAVIAALVATVNLLAYRYMLREDNHSIVQLLSGWGRVYKPILYDEIQPEIAVFGASWARDAFDPVETSHLLGRRLFNHGVSGGSPYETRRFADSALDNPRLQAAIINLDTFYRNEVGARFRYGFDESILSVDTELNPSRFVGPRRAYSLALGGWAVGANIKLISTIRARDRGVAPPDYLKSYEHGDLTRRNMKLVASRVFPKPGSVVKVDAIDVSDNLQHAELGELEIMIDRFCDRGIEVFTYFTPTHARKQSCDPQVRKKLAALDLLRRKQQSCSAKLHYFDFSYANALTLEGVLTPVKSSKYYRPDGHPRPTVGLLMAASMFGLDYPEGTPAVLSEDFGSDLLALPDAEDWLQRRAARCHGDWGKTGHEKFAEALRNL